jgi:hypothetical protein
LPGTDGPFRRSEHRGERVVLLFYPGDNGGHALAGECRFRVAARDVRTQVRTAADRCGGVDHSDDARDYVISVDAITETDIEEASVYEFRDGKIVSCTLGYPSKADALKAVGLEE